MGGLRKGGPAMGGLRKGGVLAGAWLAWWCSLATAAPQSKPGPKTDPGTLVEQIFAERRPTFCHDAEYPLTSQELAWCESVAADRRCPALARSCAAGARAKVEGWRKPFELSFPDLGGVVQTLLWIALIGLVAVLLVVLLKQRLQLPARRRRATSPTGQRDEPNASQGPGALVETDVLRLLERARAAALAGDHRRAVAEAYAALLRKLEGAGLVRLEAHRTNGDYLRDLGARQPALRPRVGEVVTAVEAVEFGGQPPGPEGFRLVHDKVVRLCSEQLGVLLLLTTALLSTSACTPERESWDESPSGRSALRELLARSGLQVKERLSRKGKLDETTDTLVVMPEAELEDGDWEVLRLWVKEGHTLVVAGAPRKPPHWLDAVFVDEPPKSDGKLAGPQRRGSIITVTVPASGKQVSTGGGRALYLKNGTSYAIEQQLGEGQVVVFADHHLFCNAALLAPGNAYFLVTQLAAAGPRVQFAGELTGIVSPNPMAAVSNGRLAPVMLQLAVCAVLFFMYRGAHFGKPRPEPAVRRRSFADHVRALGLVYARARAGRVSLEHYGAWATERLGERLRLAGRSSLSDIAEQIAARTGRPIGEVMRLLVEARPSTTTSTTALGTTTTASATRANEAEALTSLRGIAALVTETSIKRKGTNR